MILDFRLLICNLLLVASFSHVVQAETLLRWKFTEGERLQVTVDQHTVTETTGAGKPTGIDITMQSRMTWTIDSVDANGTAQITQRFERFAVTMKSGTAEPIAYASDSETKPSGSAADIAAAVEPVIGADFTVTMTNRGAIRAVKLSDAAAKAFTSVASPALKQLFSAEGITQLLGQAAVEFPEQAVAKDSVWTATFATPSPLGTLKQSRTYTVVAPEDVDGKTLERINITGQLEFEPSEQAPRKLKLLDQELTGTMLFDANAGRLASSQSTQKLTTERPYREFKIRVETTASTTTTISSG
ncbi:MAG: DUF6263 family protein [Planctomycetota bacterium]|nr:DUF6263 family protein [Planctomycetota bacterium]